jgi:hypothetical protein
VTNCAVCPVRTRLQLLPPPKLVKEHTLLLGTVVFVGILLLAVLDVLHWFTKGWVLLRWRPGMMEPRVRVPVPVPVRARVCACTLGELG